MRSLRSFAGRDRGRASLGLDLVFGFASELSFDSIDVGLKLRRFRELRLHPFCQPRRIVGGSGRTISTTHVTEGNKANRSLADIVRVCPRLRDEITLVEKQDARLLFG